jgi:hypothetical protein
MRKSRLKLRKRDREPPIEQPTPIFGTKNPERMNFSFWELMVRNNEPAYWAHRELRIKAIPLWCFNRFGMTKTQIKGGATVYIAGEHEDFYDDDFYIYNDVIVRRGDLIEIYGYPKHVFEPTDFHTATVVGQYIYIIGRLGYMHERQPGFTPVYRLNCETFQIETVVTTGDFPGWIFDHKARIGENKNVITVSGGKLIELDLNGKQYTTQNLHTYDLNLISLNWKRWGRKQHIE